MPPALKTRDLRGVEILSPGTWTDRSGKTDGYTVDDLDAIAAAYAELKDNLRPYGKLGHDKDQALAQADGYPAIGWVDALRVENGNLVADFKDIPGTVADLIEARAYDTVSSEVYFDLERDGKTFPRVLRAVAFLGANMPAVNNIKSISDVAALYSDAFAGREAHYAEHEPAKPAPKTPRWSATKPAAIFDWRAYDWGDDLPPSNVTRTLMTAMEDALQRNLQTLVRFGVISDDEEDAIQDAYEVLESAMVVAIGDDVGRRPVAGKLAAGYYSEQPPAQPTKESEMDLKIICAMYGLPDDTTEEAALAHMRAEHAKVTTQETKLTELSETVATMQATMVNERLYAEVDDAIKVGKLIPAQKEAMREYVASNPDGFRKLIAATPRMAFLSAPIGSEGDPDREDPANPTPAHAAVSAQLGVTAAMIERSQTPTARLMSEHAAKLNTANMSVPTGASA